jgi:hypothetical protein
MPDKIVINRYIDLVWKGNKPVIYVAGKEFRQCSFLAVTVPVDKLAEVNSIDQMVSFKEARALETVNDVDSYLHAVGGLEPGEHITPEAIMQAHASNLIAWVENDYNPEILNSNLSLPLLKELDGAGERKARRVLEAEVRGRVLIGSTESRMAMIGMEMDAYFDRDALAAIATDGDGFVRSVAAENPSTPPETLDMLSRDERIDVRVVVAENPSTPPSALKNLANDESDDVRERVAANVATPPGVLSMLAEDWSIEIEKSVALNHSTPPETLDILSRSDFIAVQEMVAGNPKTPPDALTFLAGSEFSSIQYAVSRNPSVPREALVILSKANNAATREYVAYNPMTPMDVLETLSRDYDAFVHSAAVNTIRKNKITSGSI